MCGHQELGAAEIGGLGHAVDDTGALGACAKELRAIGCTAVRTTTPYIRSLFQSSLTSPALPTYLSPPQFHWPHQPDFQDNEAMNLTSLARYLPRLLHITLHVYVEDDERGGYMKNEGKRG